MPVADVHVHCYPSEVITDPADWGHRHGEPHWTHLVTNGPQGWAGPEELLRAMDRDDIEAVLLQAWYWENPENALRQNDWHAAWIARYPGRFIACAAVHPNLADPVATLKAARQWGARAVGECLPQIQSPEGWRHPAWETILTWCSSLGWPIGLHLTEPVGHAYPGRIETPLMEVVDLFEAHPGQRWICAHWGGGLPFHSMNRRVRQALRNVWFDSAASPLLYDARIWRVACDLVGPEKLLFGSDFPLKLYPRRDVEPGWQRLLAEFNSSGLTADERRLIGAANFKALFA